MRVPLTPPPFVLGLADVSSLLGTHPDLGKVLYALGSMLRSSPARLTSFLTEMDGEAALLSAVEKTHGLKALKKSCALASDLSLKNNEWCSVCGKVLLQSEQAADHQAAMEAMLGLSCEGVAGTKVRGAVKGARRKWGKMGVDEGWLEELKGVADRVLEKVSSQAASNEL